MKPGTLVWMYWARLRARPVQEALAAIGIATGVALLFAVQVANSTVTGSVERMVHGITGTAQYALVSRGTRGFDMRAAARVQAIPGVQAAAPLLLERIAAIGPNGREAVQIAGITTDFASLNAQFLRGVGGLYGVRLADAIVMPSALGDRLGVGTGDRLRLELGGRRITVRVSATLGSEQVGALAQAPVIVGPLPYVQRLVRARHRITEVLVTPAPGQETAVLKGLRRVAGARRSVVPADNEARVMRQAAGPGEQSTGMFAAISALVGALLAFNAMLLTIPERRRQIVELRLQGFGGRQLATLVLFEALVLGIFASLLGLVLGDQLSRHAFHAVPGYLTFAFPIGHQRVVSLHDVVVAFAGGIVATMIAAAHPLSDVFSRKRIQAAYRSSDEPGAGVPRRVRRWLLVLAALLAACSGAVLLVDPAAASAGVAALGIAMVLVLPSAMLAALRLADWWSFRVRGGLLSIAVAELRASTTRATALAATGALAVFGSIAIEGAHEDLLRGLDQNQAAYVETADLWVTAGGRENSLTTTPFPPPPGLRALAANPAIASVRPYRGGLLDVAGHRVWVIARAPSAPAPIPAGQLVDGALGPATRALRRGGAVVASVGLAEHLGVHVGDRMVLPTPSGPASLRLVATTTNLGWSPGTVILNGADYRRLWRTPELTGVEIDLADGVRPADGARIVRAALGPASALTVQTGAHRLASLEQLSRQGLSRLSQISLLVLIAAALAMAAAMTGAVWQRRRRLAALRMQGFSPRQVWTIVVLQSSVVLAVGAVFGAVAGLAGQTLATRWVGLTTGYPTVFAPAIPLAVVATAMVIAIAMLATLAPGYAAARTNPTLTFEQ